VKKELYFMPFCPNCGSNVEPNLKFCSQCGTKLDEDQPAPQTVYVQPSFQPRYTSPQPSYAPQPAYAPQPQYPSYGTRPYRTKGTNSYGIVALICGILGLFIPFAGLFLGIIAIILGGLGTSRDDSPGMATVGIVLGVLDLICGIILISMLVILFSTPWMIYY
jgi:hypothetical protein